MESKVRPERVQLTWDEIRAIESKWKHLPAYEDVRKLTRHIRFTACLRDQEKLPDTTVSGVGGTSAGWGHSGACLDGCNCDLARAAKRVFEGDSRG